MQRTEIKSRSAKKKPSSSSHQSSTVPSNPRTGGDITQGASFLTGLKGGPEVIRPNLFTGGRLPAVAYHSNMQGPGQMGSMIPYNTPSLPPTMSLEAAAVQRQMYQSRMIQSQMLQGYPTGNWSPQNHFTRMMLNNMPTEQLVAMASNVNRFSMNGLNTMQTADGARAVSESSLHSGLSSAAPSQLGTKESTLPM